MSTQIVFIPTTIPAGTCFANEQERYNFFASHLQGYLPGNVTLWNIGSDEPSVEDRDKPWLRLNVDGSLDKVYVFFNGIWCSPYRVPADSDERMIWTGSTGDLQLYDGGNSNAVSDADGPFWEVDTAFQFRMPLGVGTSPAPNNTVVNVGDTGGEEKVTLTSQEMPNHEHLVRQRKDLVINGSTERYENYIVNFDSSDLGVELTTSKTGGDADDNTVAHQNMPPFVGVYFCKRTNRQFWTP